VSRERDDAPKHTHSATSDTGDKGDFRERRGDLLDDETKASQRDSVGQEDKCHFFAHDDRGLFHAKSVADAKPGVKGSRSVALVKTKPHAETAQ
jgi:hypothetical protein